jgi:cupin superfamily acireductone dioxygenase involved in methionine salvage
MNKYITREICDKTHAKIMEEFNQIKNKLSGLEVKLAELPEKLIEKMDGKYSGKYLESEVKSIKDKQEQRTYDWVKYSIVTFVGVIITILMMRD